MASENGHVIITDVNWSKLVIIIIDFDKNKTRKPAPLPSCKNSLLFYTNPTYQISHAMFNEGRHEARLYLKEEYCADLLWGMLAETCAETYSDRWLINKRSVEG